MRFLFSLCDERNKFIYEVAPYVFGGTFTLEEFEYWKAYRIVKNAEALDIEYRNYPFDEIVDEIQSKLFDQKLRRKEWEVKMRSRR